MSNNIEVSLSIPFESIRDAEIAYNVLRVDAEPKRNFVKKIIDINDNILKITFSGESAKNVRVGVTSFFDALVLCVETMTAFGPSLSETYDHY